jgi:hypothetical protein
VNEKGAHIIEDLEKYSLRIKILGNLNRKVEGVC